MSDDDVTDMIALKELSEASILKNIRTRYQKKLVYTYTGSILVAMNPFQPLRIYEHAVIQEYIGRKLGDVQPHIFAIAEAAFSNLKRASVNQSVIISGESGSGKSESTKHILQYLTGCSTPSQNKQSRMQEQILDANTVLEAFGNSKTSRNNNSSRFGKYIQVHISKNFSIIGASIVNYLLEKSRVSRQAPGERSYHIFYELIKGCDAEERVKYMVEPVETYEYLNQSGCTEIEEIDEAKYFQELKHALKILNMQDEDLEAVFKTVSAILWIGNVKFDSDEKNDGVTVKSEDIVLKIATLLSIDSSKFKESLCYKKLSVRGDVTMVPVKPSQAIENRNSVAKVLYDNLFQRLVDFMNRSLANQEPIVNFIGVLDIFGFENFKVNSFEQLCINYANEKLHQFFNQLIFKLEQDEYDREDIKWEKISFIDNRICLDLIESRPLGILALLDEETRVPKGSDESWLGKLEQNFKSHANFIKPKTARGIFGIKHYAGEIMYNVSGLLEKNKDAVSEESTWISNTFTSKADPVIADPKAVVGKGILGRSQDILNEGSSPKQRTSSSSPGGKTTASSYFKNQLIALVATLRATTPHYVRCIKPNNNKAAFIFDDDLVTSQLRYTGMLDTIRIRKAGFSGRIPFEIFEKRFRFIKPANIPLNADIKTIVSAMLQASNIPTDMWQTGKSLVFLKEEALQSMQTAADLALKKKVIMSQKIARGYIHRQRYKQQKAKVIVLQKYCKAFVYRQRFIKTRQSIITAQSVVRGHMDVKRYKLMLAAIKAAKEEQLRQEAELKRIEHERLAEVERLRILEEKAVADAAEAKRMVDEAERLKAEQSRKEVELKKIEQDRLADIEHLKVLDDKAKAGAAEAKLNIERDLQAQADAAEAKRNIERDVQAQADYAEAQRNEQEVKRLKSIDDKAQADASEIQRIKREADLHLNLERERQLVDQQSKELADKQSKELPKSPLLLEKDHLEPIEKKSTNYVDVQKSQAIEIQAVIAATDTASKSEEQKFNNTEADHKIQTQSVNGKQDIASTETKKGVSDAVKGSVGKKLSDSLKSKLLNAAQTGTATKLQKAPSIGDILLAAARKERAVMNETRRTNGQGASEDVFNHNSPDYSMTLYAERNFLEQSDLKIPLESSIIRKALRLRKAAIDCSYNILGLQNPNNKYPEMNYRYIMPIIKLGLDNPDLRDEIIIQLCRQVTMKDEDAARSDSEFIITNGWLAIQMITSTFQPSKSLAKFFKAFVLRTVDAYHVSDRSLVRRYAISVAANLKRCDAYLTEKREYPHLGIDGGRARALKYEC